MLYDKLVAANPDIERKGKTMPYTSANGYMFSLLNKDGEIGIRLPKATQKKLAEQYQAGPFKSHGATMRDYVCMNKSLLNDFDQLSALLKEGHQYVLSLPPK